MIALIAAIQKKDRGIGLKNDLLFKISDDLKRFKMLTLGHPIIMGRKTFDSIGRPLPNRTNIVVTRNISLATEGVIYCSSMHDALSEAKKLDDTVLVIGGGEIYRQALPFSDRIELTLVESDVQSDVFFPDYSAFSKVISDEEHFDEKTNLHYRWQTLERT